MGNLLDLETYTWFLTVGVLTLISILRLIIFWFYGWVQSFIKMQLAFALNYCFVPQYWRLWDIKYFPALKPSKPVVSSYSCYVVVEEGTKWKASKRSSRWQDSPTLLERSKTIQKHTWCQEILQYLSIEIWQWKKRCNSVWTAPWSLSYNLGKFPLLYFPIFLHLVLHYKYKHYMLKTNNASASPREMFAWEF